MDINLLNGFQNFIKEYKDELLKIRKLKEEKIELILKQQQMVDELNYVVTTFGNLRKTFEDRYNLDPDVAQQLWIQLCLNNVTEETFPDHGISIRSIIDEDEEPSHSSNNKSLSCVVNNSDKLNTPSSPIKYLTIGMQNGNAIAINLNNEILFYKQGHSKLSLSISNLNLGQICGLGCWDLSFKIHNSKEGFALLCENMKLLVFDSTKFFIIQHEDFDRINSHLKFKKETNFGGGFLFNESFPSPLSNLISSYVIYGNGCFLFYSPTQEKNRIFFVDSTKKFRKLLQSSQIVKGFKTRFDRIGIWRQHNELTFISYCEVKKRFHSTYFMTPCADGEREICAKDGVMIYFDGNDFFVKKSQNLGLTVVSPFDPVSTNVPDSLKKEIEQVKYIKISTISCNSDYLLVLGENFQRKIVIFVLAVGEQRLKKAESWLFEIHEDIKYNKHEEILISINFFNQQFVFAANDDIKLFWIDAPIFGNSIVGENLGL